VDLGRGWSEFQVIEDGSCFVPVAPRRRESLAYYAEELVRGGLEKFGSL